MKILYDSNKLASLRYSVFSIIAWIENGSVYLTLVRQGTMENHGKGPKNEEIDQCSLLNGVRS